MAVLKNTVIIGDINVTGEINASKVKLQSGTSSQFLKGDGSLDASSYSKTGHTHNYLPLSGGTLTGNLNVNGKIDSTGNHELIPITLCKIDDYVNGDFCHIYLGIPDELNIDLSNYELAYVRYSKYNKYTERIEEQGGTYRIYIKAFRWHKIKYPKDNMNVYCPEWLDIFPNDIIKFGLDDSTPSFSRCGYKYYSLRAFYVNDTAIESTTNISSYANMEYENDKIGLPYIFQDDPHDGNNQLRYRTAGRLMNHKKCGLCLMNTNGEIVSNVALLHTRVYKSGSYGIHMV